MLPPYFAAKTLGLSTIPEHNMLVALPIIILHILPLERQITRNQVCKNCFPSKVTIPIEIHIYSHDQHLAIFNVLIDYVASKLDGRLEINMVYDGDYDISAFPPLKMWYWR
jgi:hypothetical protein